jgi:AraC-like DNA-binding protein
MVYQRFDTPGVEPAERFEYWRTWYSKAIDVPMRLEPVGRLPTGFNASAEALGLGEVDIVELHCGPAFGSWTAEAIEASGQLRLVLLAPAAGTGCWHGRELPLSRGAVAVLGRTDGWWRCPDGLRGIQVNVPRRAVPAADTQIDRFNDQRLVRQDPAFAYLIRPLLLGMAGHLDTMPCQEPGVLAGVWVSLITMLFRSLASADTAGADTAAARRLQARRYIRAHLADPSLAPDRIAEALHVSRRTLYAAFAGEETVAAEIRRQRLDRARAMLLDPAMSRPVAEIGAAVGLPNPAHFSRAFRARHGLSPRALRSAAGKPGRLPAEDCPPATAMAGPASA